MRPKPFILVVLDGWGMRDETKHNPIAEAETPFFDHMWDTYPHSKLDASGGSVGLPQGQIGNSEIGHMTIGAGRIIDTDLVRISKAIESGEFEKNPVIQGLFEHITRHGSVLHLIGLVSAGGVHSHQEHLHALLHAAKRAGLNKVVIHAFTDGRDVPPQSAHRYLVELEKVLEEVGIGRIATASGRLYAMDRDNNWERTGKAEAAMFEGAGTKVGGTKPSAKIKELYQEGALDEHLEPLVFLDDTGNSYKISQNDAVFYFNFRSDRARQMSEIVMKKAKEMNLLYATMTEYDERYDCLVAFKPTRVEATLANELSKAGLTQAHIAETEKYPHATYFLNGGREKPHEGEEHIMIESRKVKTHDLAPEMRAKEIADKALDRIEKGTDFIFINFANADMVGHTANYPAVITAVETVDAQLKRVVEAALEKGGAVFITADHGNAELAYDEGADAMHTAHTTNAVPAILTIPGLKIHDGTLADITPTILEILNLPKPEVMTGKSLIEK